MARPLGSATKFTPKILKYLEIRIKELAKTGMSSLNVRKTLCEELKKKYKITTSLASLQANLSLNNIHYSKYSLKHFSTPQKKFLNTQLERGFHPSAIVESFNARFGTQKTAIQIDHFARQIGYSGFRKPAEIRAPADLKKDTLLKHYKSEYLKLLNDKSLEEKVIAVCKESINSLPDIPSYVKTLRPDKTKSVEEILMLLSDMHIGEEVSSEETGGLNYYDFPVFVRRYQFYIDSIRRIVKEKLIGYKIPKLNIAMLGDNVSGEIHDELRETSRLDIIGQVLNGAYVVAQGIRELSMEFPEVEIVGIPGNHGRIRKKKHYKRRYINWDYAFYAFLAVLLKDIGNIRTQFPKCFFVQKDINGHNFLFLHGDDIKSWMGMPWYGIERMMARFNEVLAHRVENVVMGHFHNDGSLQKISGDRILNGSFSGANEFTLGAMFTGSDPRQRILGVHKKFGVTWSYPIKLKDAPDEKIRYKYEIPFDKPLMASEVFDTLKGK